MKLLILFMNIAQIFEDFKQRKLEVGDRGFSVAKQEAAMKRRSERIRRALENGRKDD